MSFKIPHPASFIVADEKWKVARHSAERLLGDKEVLRSNHKLPGLVLALFCVEIYPDLTKHSIINVFAKHGAA